MNADLRRKDLHRKGREGAQRLFERRRLSMISLTRRGRERIRPTLSLREEWGTRYSPLYRVYGNKGLSPILPAKVHLLKDLGGVYRDNFCQSLKERLFKL